MELGSSQCNTGIITYLQIKHFISNRLGTGLVPDTLPIYKQNILFQTGMELCSSQFSTGIITYIQIKNMELGSSPLSVTLESSPIYSFGRKGHNFLSA
jgi:hypothetical protein